MKAATHTARAIPRQTMTKYLQFTIQLVIMCLGNQDKGGFSPSFNIRGFRTVPPDGRERGGDEDVVGYNTWRKQWEFPAGGIEEGETAK